MDKQQQPTNKQKPDKDVKNWLSYSGMAFELFGILGVFAAAGFFLDKKLETNPILLLVFILIGLAAGFYRFLKQFS